MLNEYAFISGDLLTDGILIFILVVFFEFTRRELFALSRSKKLLNRILEIKSIGKVNNLCLKSIDNSQLAWVTEHLVYIPKEKALEIESDGGKWLSKSSISQMLPTYDIARYRMIPAFLASVGITGTFVGITMGLKDFHLASDSVSLLSSAAGLLEGMKTAFYTSLAGLSTSALFMVVTKYASSRFSKSQAMLLTHLSRYYYEATPIYYLKRIAENTQQSTQVSAVTTAPAKSTEKKETAESPVETDAPVSTPVIEDAPANQALPVVEKQIIDTDELANKFYEAVNYSIQSNISPKLEAIVQQVLTSSQGREQSQKKCSIYWCVNYGLKSPNL